MKLTKKKLEQLITEEYVRSISDEGKPTNYPQYADKLTGLTRDGPEGYKQARELADSLDEPLNIKSDPNMEKMRIDNFTEDDFNRIYLFNDFLGYANNYYRQNNNEGDKIVPEQVFDYAKSKRLDPQETLKKLQAARKKYLLSKTTGKFDVYDHMRKQGYDVADFFGTNKK